jgi:hypothetical protein
MTVQVSEKMLCFVRQGIAKPILQLEVEIGGLDYLTFLH